MMNKLYSKFQGWMLAEDGVTGIEYGLIVGFVSIGVMVASVTVGDDFMALFNGEGGASTMLQGVLDEAHEAGVGKGGGISY